MTFDDQDLKETFDNNIKKLDLEFTATLMQLLDQINEFNKDTSDHDRLFNLIYRYVLN